MMRNNGFNDYYIKDNKVYIILTKEMETIIDIDDLDKVKQYRWTINKQGNKFYARTKINVEGSKRKSVALHSIIMGAENLNKVYIDHCNRDSLNNCKSNLRICSILENNRNQAIRKDNKSGYKGVHWHKQHMKWYANISVNKKDIFLGLFKIKEEAARKYNEAAIKYFGEFAYLNSVIKE